MEEMKIMSKEEFKNALHNQQKNLLVFGTSGIGRLTTVQRFIEQQTKKDTKDYFKNKYSTIPYVEKYIDLLIKYNIKPHKIDSCLRIIGYGADAIFIQALLGEYIADKIAELRKETPYEYGKHAIKGGEL